jgi:hypothetical protein
MEGTLWLDEETLELHLLQYSFTRLPYRVHVTGGGTITFLRLDGGGWIADSWTMWIPVLREMANRSTITLRGYPEIERVIEAAWRSDGTEISLSARRR